MKRVLAFKGESTAERFADELVHKLSIGSPLDLRQEDFHDFPEVLGVFGLGLRHGSRNERLQLIGAHLSGHELAEIGGFGFFGRHQIFTTTRFELGDRLFALFEQGGNQLDHLGILEVLPLIHFPLPDRCVKGAGELGRGLVTRLHGGFHVFLVDLFDARHGANPNRKKGPFASGKGTP